MLAHDPTALLAIALILMGLSRPLSDIAGRIALWAWRRELAPQRVDTRLVVAALQARRAQ
jgi:hypothetical protein